MKKKGKILIFTYLFTALLIFGLYIWQGSRNLARYRLYAGYSADRAFEETVAAAEGLSTALEKSLYATDPGMSGKICAQAYARALAAETAMSTLPFSTQELEELSSFLNLAGDYAYTLTSQASQEGFSPEQLAALSEMSALASDMAEYLRELQTGLNDGLVSMDSREKSYENVGQDEGELLSARLLSYEQEFRPMDELVYDGRFGKIREKAAVEQLSAREALNMAAEFAGTEPEKLKKEYDYEGTEGRSCYSAGDISICTGPGGVESMSGSRLVGDINISPEEAVRAAEEFLSKHGYENTELIEKNLSGAVMNMRFAATEDEALCMDNTLSISIAMDDGSLYSFNCMDYCPGQTEASWLIDEQKAAEKLPESLKRADSRRVIRKSPGGKDIACYEFSCVNEKGRGVKIYVDAQSGGQFDIVLEEKRA